jgi:hypothetical protein
MPAAQFSEFSFGFAYTREVVATCWPALSGHPVLPSLYDEGQRGGFDVAMGLSGWTYFAQFKRADYLSRGNASWWDEHAGPYYRFPITRRRLSRQHDLLLALEEQSVFHIVEYVAPRFHTNAALAAAFADEKVVGRSMRLFPRRVGRIDDDQHFVTYSAAGDPVVRSEPFSVEPPYNAQELGDWRPPEEDVAPVEFTSETFDQIAERLIALTRQVDLRQSRLGDGFEPMTSFGRARTLGRLLVGAELIPLVIGRT